MEVLISSNSCQSEMLRIGIDPHSKPQLARYDSENDQVGMTCVGLTSVTNHYSVMTDRIGI